MPNTDVPVTAGDMPSITRRAVLGALAASTAVVATSPADAAMAPAAAAVHDPLLDVINAFRSAMKDYCDNAPDDDDAADAYAEVTYAPAMKVIEHWNSPAVTKEGAVEAIRLAVQEARDFANSEMLRPLLAAALGYFEQEAQS